MIYWIKALLTEMVMPVPVAVLLLGAGLGVCWFTERQKLGKALATASFFWLFFLGLPVVGSFGLPSLEKAFRPCRNPEQKMADLSSESAPAQHAFVMVLGMGFNPNPGYPYTLQVSAGFLQRLLEGLRLARRLPNSTLVISIPGEATTAEKETFVRKFSRTCGFPHSRIRLVTEAKDTIDEARRFRETTPEDALCFLVTQARYMSRAKQTFEKAGIRVIPAPCAFSRPDNVNGGLTLLDCIPSCSGHCGTRQVIHEYLGILWQKISAIWSD